MSTTISLAIGLALGAPAIRLALLWHRTRLAPEGLLAVFFGGFALGIPMRLVSTGNGPPLDESAYWPATLGMVSLIVGVCGLAWFARKVFRPASPIAAAYAWATTTLTLLGVSALIVLGETMNQMHPLSVALNVWTLPLFWWAFFECLVSHHRMSRQARLGLGDPLVRNRFLLWSVWTGAFCMLPTLVAVTKLVLAWLTPEGEAARAPELLMASIRGIAMLSLVSAGIALWLSFFPPAAYVSRVRARAAAHTG